MNQLLTAFYTITTGFTVFTLGQIVINFWLTPIKNHKEVLGEIQSSLIYYANVFSPMMNKKTQDEARDKFRKLATQLVSTARVIPFYKQSSVIFGLPKLEKIRSAHHSLIGLSNSVGADRKSYVRMETLKEELDLWFKNED